MTIVIIDDETNARILLRNIITKKNDTYNIHEAKNLRDGVALIREVHPDIVFLDVEMPNEQGVEIYTYFQQEPMNFHLVFTTAYSQYALKAFELNAIDYLLKPIRPTKIHEVLQRVEESEKQVDIRRKLDELRTTLHQQQFNKIGLPVKSGMLFVPIPELIHLEADGSYTTVYVEGRDKILVSKPLKFFEHLLDEGSTFYRPHRSHIFNLKYLREYVRKDGTHVILENGNILPVSKEKKDEFLEIVTSI